MATYVVLGGAHESLHIVDPDFRFVGCVCPGSCAGYKRNGAYRASSKRHESRRREAHRPGKTGLGSHEEEGLEAIDRLLSPDFVWVDDSGVILGRTDFVKYFANVDLSDYTMENIKVTLFNPDVALVTYKVTEKGSFKGEQLPSKPYYVDLDI